MDLDTVDPELIIARGQYATCNGVYKTVMSIIQSHTQDACDELRRGLQEKDLDKSIASFERAEMLASVLKHEIKDAAELKSQKDELYKAAWGK
jgi:mannose-6-phosphate isomerase class I